MALPPINKHEARAILRSAMSDISSTRSVLIEYRDRPGLPPSIQAAFGNELGKLGHALSGLTKVADMLDGR